MLDKILWWVYHNNSAIISFIGAFIALIIGIYLVILLYKIIQIKNGAGIHAFILLIIGLIITIAGRVYCNFDRYLSIINNDKSISWVRTAIDNITAIILFWCLYRAILILKSKPIKKKKLVKK